MEEKGNKIDVCNFSITTAAALPLPPASLSITTSSSNSKQIEEVNCTRHGDTLLKLEASKVKTKLNSKICVFCSQLMKENTFATFNCERLFRHIRERKRRVEGDGCPNCCQCIHCIQRIENYRGKSMTFKRPKHQVTKKLEYVDDFIPDPVKKYIQLLRSCSLLKTITIVGCNMFLVPDIELKSKGEHFTFDLEVTNLSGNVKLLHEKYCTLLCRRYTFEGSIEKKYMCTCSCQYTVEGIYLIKLTL